MSENFITVNGAQVDPAELLRQGWTAPKVPKALARWAGGDWCRTNVGVRRDEHGVWALMVDGKRMYDLDKREEGSRGDRTMQVRTMPCEPLLTDLEDLVAFIKENS